MIIDHSFLKSLEDPSREWERLSGGMVNEVFRSENIIRRLRDPHSNAVAQLLNYLHEQGIDSVPKIVAMSDRFIYYNYIEGSPMLRPWKPIAKSDEWMIQTAHWMKKYHAVVKNFELHDKAKFLWGSDKKEGMIVCHGDLGPWNFLEQNGKITGIIDWDFAYFGSELHNLGALAIENIPLRKSKEGTMENESPDILRKRLNVFVNAYRDLTEKELVNAAIEYLDWLIQETSKCAEQGIEPMADFARRGYLQEYAEDKAYIQENWIDI